MARDCSRSTSNRVPLSGIDEDCEAPRTEYVQRLSFFTARPMLDIAALGVAVVCLFASLAVLLGSNGVAANACYL